MVQDSLKRIMIICLKNILGLTKCEEIDEILPIKTDKMRIDKEENRLVFLKEGKTIGTVWKQFGCYSNLEILTLITEEYGIEPKNNRSFELMKYKYKIDKILM